MKSSFIFVLVVWIVCGCKKVDYGTTVIKNATLTLAAPVSVSFRGPYAVCTSSIDVSAETYTYGFCYSLARNPVIPGLATTTTNYAAGSFSALIQNIEYGKKYYIRGFITNGFATAYSNQDSFFVPLYVYTDTVKNITARSFGVKIYTLPDLADSISERGVCYDTLTAPTTAGLKTISTVNDTGTISIHVNDSLKAGRVYYVRSYFIANGRVGYGNQMNFTTAGYTGSSGGLVIFNKADTIGGWQYIEAGLDTTTLTNITWGCSGILIPGILPAMGSGLENSNAIIATCTDTLSAAYYCRHLKLNNKTDWYLPAADELTALYELKLTGVIAGNPLLFSSSQADANNCFIVDFSTGNQQQLIKNSTAAFITPMRRY